jgi:RNA polymerase sigma-70 factor, ECF subfamily
MLRLVKSAQRDDPTESGGGVSCETEDRVGAPDDPLRALSEEAAAGNLQAQRTLLVAVGPTLLRVIRGILGNSYADVEDTLQEAMVALHFALRGFRGECTTLHFACRIAVQTAMNARRKAGYRTHYTPSAAPEEVGRFSSESQSPAERLAAERRREALRHLLHELPAQQAEVLTLHVLLGYTVEETAEATLVPVNTVRSRLRLALARLRSRVQSDSALLETVEESL